MDECVGWMNVWEWIFRGKCKLCQNGWMCENGFLCWKMEIAGEWIFVLLMVVILTDLSFIGWNLENLLGYFNFWKIPSSKIHHITWVILVFEIYKVNIFRNLLGYFRFQYLPSNFSIKHSRIYLVNIQLYKLPSK